MGSEGQESADSELNLIAALMHYDAIGDVKAAGVTAADFSDLEYLDVFRYIVEHRASHDSMPTWFMATHRTTLSQRRPSTPGPMTYYLERFLHATRYDVLTRAVSTAAEDLEDDDLDAAHAAITAALEDMRLVGGGRSALGGLLTGSDLLGQKLGPLQWLVQGLWVEGSYGMVGATEKSLKSYVTTEMVLGVASGTTVLGRFDVPAARPVISYIGEGGQRLLQSRMQSLALGMAISPHDVERNLYVDCNAGSLDNDAALALLARRVEAADAGLVVIDPWYRFQGGTSNAANLFEQGALLSELAVAAHPAALVVVHHFNQTGPKTGDLKRLAMAGGAEWSDSWLLLKKEKEDVASGSFLLSMSVGSRHWGGQTYLIDARIGQVNPATHQLEGAVSLRALAEDEADTIGDQEVVDREDEVKAKLIAVVTAQPWALTKSEVVAAAKVNKKRGLAVVGDLLRDSRLGQKPDAADGRRNLLGLS